MSHPMTITEKILAAHAGLDFVTPGQLINAKVDIALGNDITAPIAIKEFRQAGAGKVFDPERVVLVADHFAPNKDILSAIQCQTLRQFAQEQHLVHFYDGGEMGVERACCRKKALSDREIWLSGPTAIPARTAAAGHLRQEWVPPT